MPLYRVSYHDRTTRWVPSFAKCYASNEHELRARMRQLGRRVVSSKPIGDIHKIYYFRLTSEELLGYIDQLMMMISAGKSISEAAQRIARQKSSPKLGFMAAIVADRLLVTKVGQAFSTFPNIFPPHVTGMIAAGAAAGTLEQVLIQIRSYMRDSQKLVAAVKRGAAYPKAVSFLMVVIVFVAFGYIVPNFAKLFKEFRVALPSITLALFAIANFVQKNYIVLISSAVGSAVVWRFIKHKMFVRIFLDTLWLKIPHLNTSIQYIACSRLCGTMGVLIGSGVKAQTALASCEKVVGNLVYAQGIRSALTYLSSGRITLSEALGRTQLFPDAMIATIEIAQENGALDKQFPKLHEYYSEESRSRIERAIDTITPLLVVALVSVGGFIAAGLIFPVFDMGAALSGQH